VASLLLCPEWHDQFSRPHGPMQLSQRVRAPSPEPEALGGHLQRNCRARAGGGQSFAGCSQMARATEQAWCIARAGNESWREASKRPNLAMRARSQGCGCIAPQRQAQAPVIPAQLEGHRVTLMVGLIDARSRRQSGLLWPGERCSGGGPDSAQVQPVGASARRHRCGTRQ